MRPLYLDITGKTDSNGNATIPVKLPVTGEWHNAKIAIGTTAPAEWAVLVNGRPYTYGRGRRVTLGPELIQDGQTVTISTTGGPPAALIDGTVTGKSGEPQEIMAGFTPQPNTIALDTVGVGQVATGSSTFVPINVQLSPSFVGAIVRVLQANGTDTMTVTGLGSSQVYFNAVTPPATVDVAGGTFPLFTITQLDPSDVLPPQGIRITGGGSLIVQVLGIPTQTIFPANTAGLPLFVTTRSAQTLVDVSLHDIPTSAGLVATKSFAVQGTAAVGAVINCIAGSGVTVIRLFSLSAQTDNPAGQVGQFQDTTGADAVAIGRSTSATAPGIGQLIFPIPMAGRPLAAGAGLDFKNVAGALSGFTLTGSYSQA